MWKKWLKDMRELPQTGASFKYIGIPLVRLGYQTTLLKGVKATLSFIPLNTRKMVVQFGPLQNAFMCSAVTLLLIPDHYQEVLAHLNMEIVPQQGTAYYSKALFVPASTLREDQVTHFLASTGVPAEEVEQWRPWAVAFIAIELEEQPNSHYAPML